MHNPWPADLIWPPSVFYPALGAGEEKYGKLPLKDGDFMNEFKLN